jgi:hypothetical protein
MLLGMLDVNSTCQNYVAVELRQGEEAASVAKKLRELAAQVEARGK